MTWLRRRPLAVVLLAALAALAVTLPLSPAGALPQWDNLVLAVVGAWAAWRCGRLTQRMGRRDRLPWQVLGTSALLFAAASLLTGLGIGGSLGALSIGDALVFVAALGPTVSSALIGGRVRGTRWSSLAYLVGLPIDLLKMDRQFLADVENCPQRRALCNSVLHLGNSLGLAVVVEGVETQAELQLLRDMGHRFIQGYLLARPLDASALPRQLPGEHPAATVTTAGPVAPARRATTPAGLPTPRRGDGDR